MGFALAILLFSFPASALETDDFTFRSDAPEIGAYLDEAMNKSLREAAASLDSAGDCHPQRLHQVLMVRLGGFAMSEIEEMSYGAKVNEANGKPIEKRGTPGKESIYQDSMIQVKIGRYTLWKLEKGACCTAAFRYKGNLLSDDKLGHFLHSGYEMYYFADLRHRSGYVDASKKTSFWNTFVRNITENSLGSQNLKGEKAVIALSDHQEKSLWGLTLSGVYSYADIAANVEGYKFWKELTEGPRPFFTCKDGRWKMERVFSWGDYINPGWDEAINCSAYKNARLTEQVKTRVAETLRAQGFARTSCPVETEQCKDLLKRYRGDLRGAVSPACGTANEGSGDEAGGERKGEGAQ
jgi:hypothetical protein